MREDKREVLLVIGEGLGLEDIAIESTIRLGKREEQKTRLLRVTVESVKVKRDILQRAKKLRESEKWKKVFITPDLSPKERMRNKELREELKRRTDEGEDLVIRRGKITKIQSSKDGERHQRSASQLFR